MIHFNFPTSHLNFRKEEVERCKESDLLEELLREMAGEFPELTRILVDERDQYMAHGLRHLLKTASRQHYHRQKHGELFGWVP